MANELTGDFDVVAEFATPAANRVLAAMHRCERFPHSCAVRVDDSPPPGTRPPRPSVVGIVDTFGDATVDPNRIRTPSVFPGQFSAEDTINSPLGTVVNPDVVGATVGPVVPSLLRGRAQLQFAPPTIEVADGSGKNITVRIQVMARYFPDPHTPRVAEFGRGELQITTGVDQVASQTANVVEIDIKADNLNINFNRKWSSQPLSAEDLAGLHLLIRNALKTSFMPSNTTIDLPSNIKHLQFRTLLGAQNVLTVLLNANDPRGNPASLNNVFLGAGDDFAFAAGRDFVLAAFNQAIGNLLGQQFDFSFNIDWLLYTQHVVYTVSLNSVTVDLQNGKIVLTITGRARTGSWNLPNFDFRVTQVFTLKLVATTPGGPLNTAELAPLGDVSLKILTGGIAGWLVNRFKDRALPTIRARRDQAVSQTQPTVRRMLNANESLGGFLNSLLKPADQKSGVPSPPELKPVLAYISVEIRPSGIVLHGSLAVPDWPPARVEFQQIPANGGGTGVVGTGGVRPPEYEYTALRSWIPGGTIQRFEWSRQGQAQPFHTDENKFVLLPSPPQASATLDPATAGSGLPHPPLPVSATLDPTRAAPGYSPICLTVRGVRWSSSGPVVEQPVSASVCGYTSVSILEGLQAPLDGALLMVALTQPGPGGLVQVAGHASARPAEAGRGAPNRIVHFADEKTIGHLEFLTQALRESKREDAATAVLAVLSADQLAKSRYTEGVIYAEEQGGAWERAFGVKTTRRPLTLVVGPKGDAVWQHEGELDSGTLAATLRRVLVKGEPVRPSMLRVSLRIGQPAPNFLFEYAPGRGLTLRKLEGRPTILAFWKSASKPSIEAVRDLQKPTHQTGGQGPVVLAINDGEAAELAKKVAAENRLTATIVTDPQRKIALAYGVNLWPTTVFLDALGLVREIRYGRFAGEHVEHPSRETTAAAR